MKKLIKLTIVLTILAVFAFSSNSYIVKARTFVLEKGKVIYDKSVSKMKASTNETVVAIGTEIQ